MSSAGGGRPSGRSGRAPISGQGRAPGDPEARVARTNAALRLAGLGVLAIAFLFVSRSFTTGDDVATTPGRTAVVYADESLSDILPQLTRRAQYRYGAPEDLAAKITAGADADVFLSSDEPGLTALTRDNRCTEPLTFATRGGATPSTPTPDATPGDSSPASTSPRASTGVTAYAYCVVIRDGANAAIAKAFITQLTSIKSRDALLDAGFDIPELR